LNCAFLYYQFNKMRYNSIDFTILSLFLKEKPITLYSNQTSIKHPQLFCIALLLFTSRNSNHNQCQNPIDQIPLIYTTKENTVGCFVNVKPFMTVGL
jgi:hypothetical protein